MKCGCRTFGISASAYRLRRWPVRLRRRFAGTRSAAVTGNGISAPLAAKLAIAAWPYSGRISWLAAATATPAASLTFGNGVAARKSRWYLRPRHHRNAFSCGSGWRITETAAKAPPRGAVPAAITAACIILPAISGYRGCGATGKPAASGCRAS